jgi:peptide/nickel transport system permease protein
VLAIAVIAALGPSLPHTLVAVGIVWWPWYARIVRGEVRAQAVRSHVDAARLAGVGRTRLALRHLLPGASRRCSSPPASMSGTSVLILAGLSFIGLGSPPPAPELGAMAARGMPYLLGHPWIPLAPAIAVFLLAFAANLAGDGLRDLLEDH